MTDLLSLSPERPLGKAAARKIVAESLLLPEAELCSRPFSLLGGVATGHVVTLVADGDGEVPGALELPLGGGRRHVCVIGAFDGMHRGHRELVARARREASERGDDLVAVTFSPDPADVLADGPAPSSRLLPVRDRVRTLCALGIPQVVVLDFTPELAALTHERFVRDVLGALVGLDAIVVGSDFRLGARGAGDVTALVADGRELGFDVIGMDLVGSDGATISATRIRGLLREGRVEAAADLLGRCHFVTGRVGHGRGKGTSFGFPTANVACPAVECLPESGVYAGYVVVDGIAWPAAINVGVPPTFDEGAPAGEDVLLEANLVGFAGDLYGERVSVSLVRWLRDSRPFDSLEELEATVLSNIGWTRDVLGATGVDLRTSRAGTLGEGEVRP